VNLAPPGGSIRAVDTDVVVIAFAGSDIASEGAGWIGAAAAAFAHGVVTAS
jgi:hypothetical protein